MNLTRTRLGVALATAAVAITTSMTVVVSPAHAEDDMAEGGHCVLNTVEEYEKCFETYQEAEAFVRSLAEVLPPKRSGQGFNVGPASAGVLWWPRLIFIGFDWPFLIAQAGTLWVWGYDGSCTDSTGDVDYRVARLPSRWDNDISSYMNFSNCWTRLFKEPNFGGAYFGYRGDSSTLGSFDNVASSIRWS